MTSQLGRLSPGARKQEGFPPSYAEFPRDIASGRTSIQGLFPLVSASSEQVFNCERYTA